MSTTVAAITPWATRPSPPKSAPAVTQDEANVIADMLGPCYETVVVHWLMTRCSAGCFGHYQPFLQPIRCEPTN